MAAASTRETEESVKLLEEGAKVEEVTESEKKEHSTKKRILLIIVWIFYLTAGPSTIFLNGYVLKQVHFPYPATLSMLGVLASTVFSSTCIRLGFASGKQIRQLSVRSYIIRICPIGFALAGTLAFGNKVYLHLSVAFIQILKAFSPVILLTLLLLARLETARSLLLIAVAIISIGTAAATQGELHATFLGVLYMFLSEFFEAIKAIFLQLLLRNSANSQGKNKFEAIESIAAFGPAALLGLASVSFLTEDLPAAFAIIRQHPTLFIFASCSGLAVNFATSLFIKYTSALTLRVTSLGRNVGIILISACIFPDSTITLEEFAGYTICLLGCLLYQHARSHTDESIHSLAHKLFGRHLPSFYFVSCCTKRISHSIKRTSSPATRIVKEVASSPLPPISAAAAAADQH